MDDGSPTLEVGFAIGTGNSFGELERLRAMMNSSEATALKAASATEQAYGRINLSGARAQFSGFGDVATRETARVEKAGDRLTGQLQRQIDYFGKTAAQIRTIKVDKLIADFERLGNAADADRLRALNAEMLRLESGAGRAGASVGGTRAAMQGLSFQAQDAFTQISMGTNAFSVLAIQGGQAAGQMTMLEGRLGSFARFMVGPWGLAITGALLVLGALTKGMFDNENASKAAADGMKKFQDRQSDIGNFIDATTGKLIEQNRNLVINAILTRQANIAANDKAVTDGRNAAFEAARRTYTASAPSAGVGTAGGPIMSMRVTDPAVLKVIQQANGDVEKLTTGLFNLSKVRPDLKDVTLQVSGLGGAAVIAKRENEKLGKELRALNGDTTALATSTTSLIGKQVALATATTPLARARAQLALVEQGAAAADKLGGAALTKYRTDLTAATTAVNAAEAAEKAASGARRDSNREARQAATAAKSAQRDYEALVKAATDYARAQEQVGARLGMSAKGVRLLEDAAARAKAPTQALREEIDRVAAGREAAFSIAAGRDFETGVLGPLRDELALYGLIGPARAQAALELEMEGFLARNMAAGINDALQKWREYYDIKSKLIANDAAAEREVEAIRRAAANMDDLVASANRAADAMGRAFGRAGDSIGDALVLLTQYQEQQQRIGANKSLKPEEKAARMARLQLETTTSLIGATKALFSEKSKAYKAMEAAEKALAVVQLARTAIDVAGGAAKMFSTLGPLGFPAVAAMLAVMASLGFRGGGSAGSYKAKTNDGSGTVLGDKSAPSESLKRSIDLLRDVDTTTLVVSRQMAASLRSIDQQIGGVASVLIRSGNLDASANVQTGFKSNATPVLAGIGALVGGPIGAGIGALLTKVPIVGDILKGLFGTSTKVLGGGISGGAVSLDAILAGAGVDARTYSDVQTKKKLFGITTSNKTKTVYGSALDSEVTAQFGLLLRSFNTAIIAAAGPLGETADQVKAKLAGFKFSLGKIDFTGLSGEEIQSKLSAVFGAAADQMAEAAFPGLSRMQKVGEGAFETLVRVASTIEAVSDTLGLLGNRVTSLGIEAKVALANQFETVGDFTSAAQSYFDSFYTKEEQAVARAAQLGKVFGSLNLVMPRTLDSFRGLVDAQDLTTDAGRSTYATLLKLAPAFSDLLGSLGGAKTAADAAEELREAWTSIGDSIMEEVRRIRGVTDAGGGSFATLQGRFNATTLSARAGDQAAAKLLPGLSQALLEAAEKSATSRQELERVRALTAASLEGTYGSVMARAGGTPLSIDELLDRTAASQAATTQAAANDVVEELHALNDNLTARLEALEAATTNGLASVASGANRSARVLENVSGESGGNAFQFNVAV